MDRYYEGSAIPCVRLSALFPLPVVDAGLQPHLDVLQAAKLVEQKDNDYVFSAGGEKAYVAAANALCFGRIQVAKLNDFADYGDMKVADYELALTDIAPWAQTRSFQEAFPDAGALLAVPFPVAAKAWLVPCGEDSWRVLGRERTVP